MTTPQIPDPPQEPTTTPSAIIDQRPPARGALPRRAQMWVMLGIAGALLAIIFATGNPTPRERPAPARSAPAPIDTERVTGYQQQLAQRHRELASEMNNLRPPTPAAVPADDLEDQHSSPPIDPLQDEKRRREYSSLFASNVALSSRQGANQAAQSASAPLSLPPLTGGLDSELQLLEAQGRESIARLNASVSALERAAATPPTPPVTVAATTSQAEEGVPPAHTPPIRPGGQRHPVLEGTVLEAVLMTRLDGDFSGPVMCLTTTPLYSHYGDALLIPAGSKVLGRARAVDTWGQRRLAVSFHRLLLPDGTTYALDNFVGLNQIGDTGLKDKVNHHYLATFGTAAAVGLMSGLAQYVSAGALGGGDGDGDRTVVIAGSGADSTSQAVSQVLNRYTNRLPTITIREGHRVKVYMTRDLEFPAYRQPGAPTPPTANGGF